ncbi:IS30 family transposase [Dysosmobacter sp.]
MRLSWNDRLDIEKLVKKGCKAPAIARKLGVHHSTIYDELKRGAVELLDSEYRTYTGYSPEVAEAKIEQGKRNREKPLKIGHDHALASWLVDMIGTQGYSPSAACSLLGKTPETTFSCTLTRQTVYKYIDQGHLWPLTNKELRFKGNEKRTYKTVKRASRASAGTSIERRGDEINNREEPGHWEMDCVEGKKKTRRVLLVLTERVTRQEIIMPMRDQTAASVVRALDRLEKRYGKKRFREIFRSITVDNGSEFSDCAGMERSLFGGQRTKMYYCHPRYPGERGSNEKQNQMIRWFFPKGTDFTKISDKKIQSVADWINNYPRLLLGWHTSNELFGVFLASVA